MQGSKAKGPAKRRLGLGCLSGHHKFLARFLNRELSALSMGGMTPLKNAPGGSDGEESAYNAGDPGLIPGSGRCPGEGNGYPLQYSCLENPTDRGAWWATVHGVAKSWTRLSGLTHKDVRRCLIPSTGVSDGGRQSLVFCG